MNYRHLYHAGNFADVMKHALLLQLVQALQKKEKGFLYLDTHAGRGSYDLSRSARGDTLARRPEWPDGIGRILSAESERAGRNETAPSEHLSRADAALAAYAALVREFDRAKGNPEAAPRYYPGSPALVSALARPQERLVLCEQLPEECAALAQEFCFRPATSVHAMDGYVGIRAMLPPPERRALVLIDPPYEAQDEFARIAAALEDVQSRLASAVIAVWYPLTERARIEAFFLALETLRLPPTLALELTIAGESSPLKMRGCGLVVVNPPWRFEKVAVPLLEALAHRLAQAGGGGARLQWLVPET